MIVLGGDGTILRGAEWVMASDTPLLGVNLGHVGFLAEAESSEIDSIVERVVDRSYRVEERFTIDLQVRNGNEVIWSSFAINEVSIEKSSRERMLEVLVEIDGRPLSRWACDGLLSTPTGSTAYAFSAGGPVIWPGVDAFLVVPLARHALFARPLVPGRPHAWLWNCSQPLRPRACCPVTVVVRWNWAAEWRSRLSAAATDCGWRGFPKRPSRTAWSVSSACGSKAGGVWRTVRSYPIVSRRKHDRRTRIADLGVISDATMSFHPGLTVVTGETGAGKTMIITGLGLLLGGRADPKLVRSGSDRARIEGRFVASPPEVVDRMLAAGGELDADGELLVARHLTASRSRAFLGGASVPAGLHDATADLVTIHGQSEQLPGRRARPPAPSFDRSAGKAVTDPLDAYSRLWAELQANGRSWPNYGWRPSLERGDRLLRFGLDEIERVAPGPRVRISSWPPRPTADRWTCALPRSRPACTTSTTRRAARRLVDRSTEGVEQTRGDDVELATLGAGWLRPGYALTDITAELARYLNSWTSSLHGSNRLPRAAPGWHSHAEIWDDRRRGVGLGGGGRRTSPDTRGQ